MSKLALNAKLVAILATAVCAMRPEAQNTNTVVSEAKCCL
jgi:hypothetical protein